jgi:hypothetical protein
MKPLRNWTKTKVTIRRDSGLPEQTVTGWQHRCCPGLAIHPALHDTHGRWTVTHLASGLSIATLPNREQAARCAGILACSDVDFGTLSKSSLIARYGSSYLCRLFREAEQAARPERQLLLWKADWKAYVDDYEKVDWNAFALPAA